MDVSYLSPHADDVAFSAAAHLARDVAAGLRVTLVTVFEGEASGPFGGLDARRREDEAFARSSGVTLLRWGFPDAQVRHPRYRRLWRVLGPLPAEERPLVGEISARIRELGCKRVVGPAGIGHHVDHQIVSQALHGTNGGERWAYEDSPYVFSGRGWLSRARFWRETPLFSTLPVGISTLAAASVAALQKNANTVGIPHVLHDIEDVKMKAVACYESQWRQFFSTLDDWRTSLRDYSRSMASSTAAERVWQL